MDIEAAFSKRGNKVTPEQSKKITDAALVILAIMLVVGGFAGFFALQK